MIAIIQRIAQIGVEGVDVVQTGEVIDDMAQFLGNGLLGEFYFAHVEVANSCDLVARVNYGRRTTLCPCQHNVHEIAR